MNIDNFTRHVAAITIALLALLFSCAVIWQVIHGHEVDALLAGLVGTTLGYLIPSPSQTGRVTVDNEASDPIPVQPAKPKRADKGFAVIGWVIAVLVVLLIVAVVRGV